MCRGIQPWRERERGYACPRGSVRLASHPWPRSRAKPAKTGKACAQWHVWVLQWRLRMPVYTLDEWRDTWQGLKGKLPLLSLCFASQVSRVQEGGRPFCQNKKTKNTRAHVLPCWYLLRRLLQERVHALIVGFVHLAQEAALLLYRFVTYQPLQTQKHTIRHLYPVLASAYQVLVLLRIQLWNVAHPSCQSLRETVFTISKSH